MHKHSLPVGWRREEKLRDGIGRRLVQVRKFNLAIYDVIGNLVVAKWQKVHDKERND